MDHFTYLFKGFDISYFLHSYQSQPVEIKQTNIKKKKKKKKKPEFQIITVKHQYEMNIKNS